jgi:hypothetical protein
VRPRAPSSRRSRETQSRHPAPAPVAGARSRARAGDRSRRLAPSRPTFPPSPRPSARVNATILRDPLPERASPLPLSSPAKTPRTRSRGRCASC